MELYDYQKADLEKMIPLDRILNYNPMGYGKTIESCAAVDSWKSPRVLVICPQPTIGQWTQKFEEICDRPTIEMPQRIPLDKKMIVVTNYEQVANGKMVLLNNKTKKFVPGPRFREFVMFRWDLIILDEAHRIKNRDSKTSMALDQLPGAIKMELTGTPIITRPDDLYNLLKWANIPGVDSSYWSFILKYCEIQNNGFGKKPVGATKNQARLDELNKLMEPYLIKNADRVYAGSRVNFVPLIMTEKQTKLYKDISALMFEELPENCTIFNAVGKSMRLRQTTVVPEKFGLDHNDNIKLLWLISVLEDNPNTTFVVFSWFSEVVNNICDVLTKYKIGWSKYTGDLNTKEKDKSKKDFISGVTRVFVATIGAAGTGLDGLQSVCHTAIFFDRDWSPAINKQAECRLDRDGQTQFVNIYVLEARGTYDRHMGKINLDKAESIERIFKYEDGASN